MKNVKTLVAGAVLMGGLLTLSLPAFADSHHGDFRRDRRELSVARAELRHDFRRGAGPHEIARDRAAIARERRDIWQNRRDWRYDRWHDNHGYRPWHRS